MNRLCVSGRSRHQAVANMLRSLLCWKQSKFDRSATMADLRILIESIVFDYCRAFDRDDAATLSLLDAGYSRVKAIFNLNQSVNDSYWRTIISDFVAVYDWIASNIRLHIKIAWNSIFIGSTAKYYCHTTGTAADKHTHTYTPRTIVSIVFFLSIHSHNIVFYLRSFSFGVSMAATDGWRRVSMLLVNRYFTHFSIGTKKPLLLPTIYFASNTQINQPNVYSTLK